MGDIQQRFVYLGIQADINDTELKKLKDKIYSISHDQKIKIDAGELTSAVEVITEKSGDLELARQNLKNMGLAIRATGASGADIGAMVNNLKEKFGVEAPAQIRAALETLVVQGKAGSYTLKDLAQQGERVTAAYAAMGRTGPEAVREMGALLQVFRKGTGSSEQATTAFEAVMRDLVKKAPQLRKELPGFEIWDPEKSRWENGVEKRVAKPVNQILLELLKRTGGDIEILQKYFGEESARGLKVLITEFQKNKGDLPLLKEFMAVKGDTGQLEKDSQRAAATINADLAVTNSKIEKALSDKGEGLVGSVTEQISKLGIEDLGNALNWGIGGIVGLSTLWAGKKAFNLARGVFGGKGGGPGQGGGPGKSGLWNRFFGSGVPGAPLPVRVTNWPGGGDGFGGGADGPEGPERGKKKRGGVKKRGRVRSGLRKSRSKLGRAAGFAREALSRTGGKLKAKIPFSRSTRTVPKASVVKQPVVSRPSARPAANHKPEPAKASLAKETPTVKPKPSRETSFKSEPSKANLINESPTTRSMARSAPSHKPQAVTPKPQAANAGMIKEPSAAKAGSGPFKARPVKQPAAVKNTTGPAVTPKPESAKASLFTETPSAKPRPQTIKTGSVKQSTATKGAARYVDGMKTGAVKNSLAQKIPVSKMVNPLSKPGFWGSLFSGVVKKIGGAASTALGTVSKTLAKAGGKSLVKKVPVLSMVAGTVFATQRALAGDWTGALMEMGSGLASTLLPTGPGQAISLGLDAGLVARDAELFSASAKPSTQKATKPEDVSKEATEKSAATPAGEAKLPKVIVRTPKLALRDAAPESPKPAQPKAAMINRATEAAQAEKGRQPKLTAKPPQAQEREKELPEILAQPARQTSAPQIPPPLISLNPPRPPDRSPEIHLHVDQRTNLPAGSLHDELMRLLTSNNTDLAQTFKQILEEIVRRERGVSFGYGSY